MKRRSRMTMQILTMVVILAVTAVAHSTAPQQPKEPLGRNQVMDLVKAGMDTPDLVKLIGEHGIDFDLTDEYVHALLKAGAREAVIRALRAVRSKPLSKEQVLELVAGHVPSQRAAVLVKQRGIDFEANEEYLKTLRLAGADEELITALRESRPQVNEADSGARLLLNPHDKKAHEQVCSMFEERGDYRGLVNELKAWLHDNPDDYNALIELEVDANSRLDDPEFAIDATRGFLDRLKPDDYYFGLANDYLGRQLLKRDRIAEACPLFEAATRADPEANDFLANLGECLVRAGDSARGFAALHKAISVNPSYGFTHERLGDALGRTGEYRGQETEYKASQSLFEETDSGKKFPHGDWGLLMKLARVQIEQREFADAEANIEPVLRTDDLGAFYGHLLHARILELKGNNAAAREEREKAASRWTQEMQKEKPENRFEMAVPMALVALDFDDPDEAVRLYSGKDRLTQLDHATLASAHSQQGRWDDALTELQKAAVGKGETAKIRFGLAELLKRAGRLNEAVEQYRRAYEMDPANLTYMREFEDAQRQVSKP